MRVPVNSSAEPFLAEETFQRHAVSFLWMFCVSLRPVIIQDIRGHELLITGITGKLQILLGQISVEILSVVQVNFLLVSQQISFYSESSVAQLAGIILLVTVSKTVLLQTVILDNFPTDLASAAHAGIGDFVDQISVFVEDIF